MAEKKNPLGPTGETVRANIARHRAGLNLGYAELSRQLEALGRPIPVLGLSRIEKGERRVDADDLMALAVVLDVPPADLLLPYDVDKAEKVEATGFPEGIDMAKLRHWVTFSTYTGLPFAIEAAAREHNKRHPEFKASLEQALGSVVDERIARAVDAAFEARAKGHGNAGFTFEGDSNGDD
ncbi:helix-turn-helix domain-containing protein [Nocardia salmonicida]|uniref:helix-turn-helix domain-containing protein n=1 Tax=Nocardia salmonicida TaxID=53431 RepID=UPI00363F1895